MMATARPVALSVAGFDGAGFSGAVADLRVFQDFDVAARSVLTALTVQSEREVIDSQALALERVRAQLSALRSEPAAVKIGMLGDAAIVEVVTEYAAQSAAPVVCDPVLAASDATPLLDEAGVSALSKLLPHCDLITPNAMEASALVGEPLESLDQAPAAAKKLLARGVKAVLIKGGHLANGEGDCWDWFESSSCGFWLKAPRLARDCRGTGCALSSAIAAALALGWPLPDAVVLGRAYLQRSLRLACGNRLAAAGLDFESQDLPSVSSTRSSMPMFPAWPEEPPGLYPVVDSAQWVRKLGELGVRTVQLRIKDESAERIKEEIAQAMAQARRFDLRLLINDHWEEAIAQGAWGAHLGQEDLHDADLRRIADAGLRLGLSTHSWWEIARALALNPSYIAFGPVFATDSKPMAFAPLGLGQLRQWCRMTEGLCARVGIGGVTSGNIKAVMDCGVDGAAMIGAIARAPDWRAALMTLRQAMD